MSLLSALNIIKLSTLYHRISRTNKQLDDENERATNTNPTPNPTKLEFSLGSPCPLCSQPLNPITIISTEDGMRIECGNCKQTISAG